MDPADKNPDEDAVLLEKTKIAEKNNLLNGENAPNVISRNPKIDPQEIKQIEEIIQNADPNEKTSTKHNRKRS